jgi:acylphosphatase
VVDPLLIRKQALFQGHVQGVGFRFTTCQVARQFAVAGFVRNLADGRVEVVVEGAAAEIDRFLKELRETMSSYIRQVHVDTQPASGEFRGFVAGPTAARPGP